MSTFFILPPCGGLILCAAVSPCRCSECHRSLGGLARPLSGNLCRAMIEVPDLTDPFVADLAGGIRFNLRALAKMSSERC